jgi:hypothetical protein
MLQTITRRKIEITVPKEFSLERFKESSAKLLKNGVGWNISDNYFKPTMELPRDRPIIAVIEELIPAASLESLVEYIKERKGIFSNALGLAAAWEFAPDRTLFPKKIYLLGVDERTALYKGGGGGFEIPALFLGSSQQKLKAQTVYKKFNGGLNGIIYFLEK